MQSTRPAVALSLGASSKVGVAAAVAMVLAQAAMAASPETPESSAGRGALRLAQTGASRTVAFNIQSQPMSEALTKLGEQSGLTVIVETRVSQGIKAPAVSGRYTPEEALKKLLEPSGLKAEYLDSKTVAVRVASQSDSREPHTTRAGYENSFIRLAQAQTDTGASRDLGANGQRPDDERGSTDVRSLDAGRKGTGEGTREGEAPEQVVVTGSRIARRDYTATSPIVTVGSDFLQRSSSVGIEASLNQLPQFQPGQTQFSSSAFVQPNAFGGLGAATVNLRGLGTNRTLVLIDGRRAQPSDATLVVDVNSIPSAAIENVEIITGGASAVYGADALAGVVNFILKKDFEGIAADVQSGITEQGDGAETHANVLIGSRIAEGRGNVMFGIDWSKRDGVYELDRDFYNKGLRDPGTTGASLFLPGWRPVSASDQASVAALNAVYSNYPAGSASRTGNNYFNADGTLLQNISPENGNYKGGSPFVVVRSNGLLSGSYNPAFISSPLERYSIFGRATYNFNDSVSGYIQGNFASTEVASQTTYAPAVTFWDATIPADFANYPVPAALQTLLQSRANPTAPWSFDQWVNNIPGIGPEHATTNSSVYQVLAGLKGTIPRIDWTWDAYVSRGRTSSVTALDGGFISLQNYRNIIQAPQYGKNYVNSNGSSYGYGITCTSGLNPFAILNGMTVSQDCLNALKVTMKNSTDLAQNVAEVNTQGKLFNFFSAGEVRGALGASYRKDDVAFLPDRLLSSNDVSEQQIGLFSISAAAGFTEVKEAYGELLVPVLHDLPVIKLFELELGERYSNYNTAGGQNTWKALANWTVNDYVSFRGGLQHAARAPNAAELFSGTTLSTVGFAPSDPCAITTQAPWGNVASNPHRAQIQALCSALIGSGTSIFDQNPNAYGAAGFLPGEIAALTGNPKLKPEIARTTTLGTVLRSPFDHPALRKLTASIDWYHIEIEGLIGPLDPLTTYMKCFNSDGVSNPTYSLNDPGGYCKLIHRDPISGDRHSVDSPYINLGGLKTSGVDLQLNWGSDLADLGLSRAPGAISVNYLVNYISTYQSQTNPGQPFLEYVGTVGSNLATSTGQYRWRSYATFGYDVSTWTFRLGWRHLPSARDVSTVSNPASTVDPVKAYDNFNFYCGWQFNQSLSFRAGIDNLFDAKPVVVGANPPATNNAASTVPAYYDVLGRRYYAGVKLDL